MQVEYTYMWKMIAFTNLYLINQIKTRKKTYFFSFPAARLGWSASCTLSQVVSVDFLN